MADITVYWRPGCVFCAKLMRQLKRAGVDFYKVDIWQDDRAAAKVREASGGDETVPAVQIDGHVLSNPTVRQVLSAAGRLDPDTDLTASPARGLISRWAAYWRGRHGTSS